MTFTFEPESAMEFRIATYTSIGQSKFSKVVDTECVACNDVEMESKEQQLSGRKRSRSATGTGSGANQDSSLRPPTFLEVELVTQNTAELVWTPSVVKKIRFYCRVQYWQDGQDSSSARHLHVESKEIGCRLELLQPDTTYFVNIVVVSNEMRETSQPSKIVSFTTAKGIRFSEAMANLCEKIRNRNGMDLYPVPLTKTSNPGAMVERFVFGAESGQLKQHKVILIMGATGSGKSTLINSMINYIFDVDWQDRFRFQLIENSVSDLSVYNHSTDRVTAYDIYHLDGFRIPYSLTIIDTPGYGDPKNLNRSQENTEIIRQFFENPNGIQQLDLIGFVAEASALRLTPSQLYIFDSLVSIFGRDITEKIEYLLTFANIQSPRVLSAIVKSGLPYTRRPLKAASLGITNSTARLSSLVIGSPSFLIVEITSLNDPCGL